LWQRYVTGCFLQCIQLNWLYITLAESHLVFVFFSIFVREFPVESLGRKYFGFPQVLMKILSSELVIIMHEVA